MNTINFYDLLYETIHKNEIIENTKKDNNNENQKITNEEDVCLISLEPLEKNHITLLCGHKFNYESIFNEVYSQKYIKNYNEIEKLTLKQIKCPYCRNIQNKLLPKHPNFKKMRGINSPDQYCMFQNNCHYVFRNGKRKGETCNKSCFDEYCKIHLKMIEKQKNKVVINQCKGIIKSGKNKGTVCGKACENDYCKKHSKNYKLQIDTTKYKNCNTDNSSSLQVQSLIIGKCELNDNETDTNNTNIIQNTSNMICDVIKCNTLVIGKTVLMEKDIKNILNVIKSDVHTIKKE